MNLTDNQRDAVEIHDRNLVVVAGAGSGKTRVLVERYVRLLEANPTWPLTALVAITFTRKAAGEMLDRVRQRLEEKLRDAAEQDIPRWAELLASMDSARITTIHGLCADILRANAAMAQLDPKFDVMDEDQAAVLMENAIGDALESLAAEGHPAAQLFEHYDTYAIRAVLRSLIGQTIEPLQTDLMAIWTDQWREETALHFDALLHDGDFAAALDTADSLLWPRGDKLTEVWDACKQHLNVLYQNGEIEARLTALTNLAAVINVRGGSAANWGDKAMVEAARDALKALRECAKGWLEWIGQPPDKADQTAAELLPLWDALIRYVQEAYDRVKKLQNALDFDDLERLTHKLLNESGHKARVLERYKGEFRHVLVDEFQDTNQRQWEIIQALVSPSEAGRLFIVGDPKQSIYAFRGADVQVFNAVRRQITDVHLRGGKEIPLPDSFRAHEPLVDCFNSIFRQILVRNERSLVPDYEIAYEEDMRAVRQPPGDACALRLLLIGAYSQKLSADEARHQEAYELAQYIQQTVQSGALHVYDRATRSHRPIEYRDFALLFRAMTNVNLYEDALKNAGVPYITIAGRGYYSRQEVWDLLNLLNALYNPLDDLSLATVLRSPLFNLSDDALLALRLLEDQAGARLSLWQALADVTAYSQGVPDDELPRVAFTYHTLQDLRDLAGRVTISELLREALDRTGYLAVLTGLPDGDRRRGNVEKLVEKAQTSGYVTLGSFTQYLRDMSEREIREGEALLDAGDAVTLMTVHASKGLEFPHVILVDTSSVQTRPDAAPIAHDKQVGLVCRIYDQVDNRYIDTFAYRHVKRRAALREVAERRRLFYVAATRAQDYLLVSGNLKSRMLRESWLGWLLDALALDISGLRGETAFEVPYAWGKVQVALPKDPPPEHFSGMAEAASAAWDLPPPESYEMPPLLAEIKVDRSQFARHLTATQIADLGSPEPYHRRRFRQRVLRDPAADLTLPSASERVERPTGRQLGEIVHEALRWWHAPDPDSPALIKALENYAWEQGVSNKDARDYAVQKAREWLRKIVKSDVFQWITDASQAFRELPFVYQNQKRIIHGVIDVLIKRDSGTWAVIDYKTSYVPEYANAADKLAALARHAERYHLQVGVYAAAVRDLLDNVTPETYIHYIRYQQTVEVHPRSWQMALDQLENRIGSFVSEDDLL